ncbi:MAG: hypothetical protein ACNI3A_13370 [Desulfovibrio sp.]|uniref:hypothetical protein n=1 Tax=Desulfovibrio sp. 7SRBS1 TaxID=3378064 RepID=UPI003B3F308F
MFRQLFCLLFFTFAATSLAGPLCAQAVTQTVAQGGSPSGPITLVNRQWNTGPGGTNHTTQCVKSLVVPIPPSCKGKSIGYTLHGNDPNQGSLCRIWIVFDKKQSHSTPINLHIKGAAVLSGSAGPVPDTPVRHLHITCSAGRFTPMQLSVSLQCTGGSAEEAFAKDLDTFLQTK